MRHYLRPAMQQQAQCKTFLVPTVESNNPQQVRPEGDPALDYFERYVAAARCFEQHNPWFWAVS